MDENTQTDDNLTAPLTGVHVAPAAEKAKQVEIPTPSHMLSMTAMVNTEEEWRDVYAEFSKTLEDLGPDYPSLSMSSTRLDEIEDEAETSELPQEISDEDMAEKFAKAMYASGALSPRDFVDVLKQDGVVFVRDGAMVSKGEFWDENTLTKFKNSLGTSGIFAFPADIDQLIGHIQADGFIVKERREGDAPSYTNSPTVYLHSIDAIKTLEALGLEDPESIVRDLNKAGIMLKTGTVLDNETDIGKVFKALDDGVRDTVSVIKRIRTSGLTFEVRP